MELNKIYNEDCLIGMKKIPDKSVDMILCDLPYGTTACKWDTIIPLEELWEQYNRVIKENGAIVLTASQPFTTKLINSNIENFKYIWVWNKKKSSTALLAKIQPLKIHEDIVVFYKKKPLYKPQMTKGKPRKDPMNNISNGEAFDGRSVIRGYNNSEGLYYPKSILEISNANQNNKIHPTQKPVALFEYLIKTYTNEGDTVLDNCMGSGTTAIACINTKRNYIGFELDEEYYRASIERINNHVKDKQIDLFEMLDN